MKSKLTLSIQQQVMAELVSSQIVKELKGSIKMPKEFKSYKETLEDALIRKYL